MRKGIVSAGVVLAGLWGCALDVAATGDEGPTGHRRAAVAAPFSAVSAELRAEVKGGAVLDPQTGGYLTPAGVLERPHEAGPASCGAPGCLHASPAPQAPMALSPEAFEVIRDWEYAPDGSFHDPSTGATAGLVAGGLCHRIPCVVVILY